MERLGNSSWEVMNLEKLTLHCQRRRQRHDGTNTDLLQNFRPNLPKLRHFELYDAYTTESFLITLLTSFRGTLKGLRLEMLSLVQSDTEFPASTYVPAGLWSSVLTIFKSESWNLDKIHLKKLSYNGRTVRKLLMDEYLISVKNAILHGVAYPQKEFSIDYCSS